MVRSIVPLSRPSQRAPEEVAEASGALAAREIDARRARLTLRGIGGYALGDAALDSPRHRVGPPAPRGAPPAALPRRAARIAGRPRRLRRSLRPDRRRSEPAAPRRRVGRPRRG